MNKRADRGPGEQAVDASSPIGNVEGDLQKTMGQAMRQQAQRQERLRHVQEFLSAPTFLDLGTLGLEYTDPPEALEERWRDLDYRVAVLHSILAMMEEERDMLSRLLADGETPADSPAGEAEDAAEDPGDLPAPKRNAANQP